MKFSVIAVLSALVAPLVYAAALSHTAITALGARDTDNSPINYEDVVGYALPNGTRKIDFYLNGAFQGSAVETTDGAEFFDASGASIDLDQDVEHDGQLEKRVNPVTFAIRFAKLLAKWGQQAWNFFYCISLNVAWKCSDEFIDCATQGIPPWACVSGGICVGSAFGRCK